MKKLFSLILAAAGVLAANAQQALWGIPQIVSPEINADTTVTFRFKAPEARSVQITGDFLPTRVVKTPYGDFDAPGVADLVKGDDGLWEFTSGKLAPELYSYRMIVDGLLTTDPSNVYTIRDVATVTNVFLIGGDRAGLYAVNDVPHGTVSRVWYDSPGLGMKRRLSVYTPPAMRAARSATRCCICFTAWAAMRKRGWRWDARRRFSTISSRRARPSR